MSTVNGPDPAETVTQGLGKLATGAVGAARIPDPETATVAAVPVVPDRWARTRLYAKRTALVILALLCMAFSTVAGIFLSNPDIRHMLWKMGSAPSIILDPTAVYNVADNFPPDKHKAITVLVMGSDHDTVGVRVKGHMPYPVNVLNAPGRSDAIMIARFEFDNGAVSSLNVLSVPRDTRVLVPGHGIHKINAAHAYGGPELVCATVRDVFGIDPDYYIDLNFEGFQQVVDAVGGVDVNVRQQLDYDDNWGQLHIHLKPGPQHLNGYQAMGYVRFRHTDNDLARAQRQHEFLDALRSRITARNNFMALPNLVSAVTRNLHSTMTMDQILTLANVARKAPKDAVCLETLPVVEGKTFVYIDKRRSVAVIRKMFFKDKLLAEDLKIKTPEMDSAPTERHRRRVHDKAPTGRSDANPSADAEGSDAVQVPVDPGSEPAGPPAPTTGDSGSRSDKPDKSDKPEKSTPPETPKQDSGTGEGGKSGGKSGEGTGTSSGATSSVVRG